MNGRVNPHHQLLQSVSGMIMPLTRMKMSVIVVKTNKSILLLLIAFKRLKAALCPLRDRGTSTTHTYIHTQARIRHSGVRAANKAKIEAIIQSKSSLLPTKFVVWWQSLLSIFVLESIHFSRFLHHLQNWDHGWKNQPYPVWAPVFVCVCVYHWEWMSSSIGNSDCGLNSSFDRTWISGFQNSPSRSSWETWHSGSQREMMVQNAKRNEQESKSSHPSIPALSKSSSFSSLSLLEPGLNTWCWNQTKKPRRHSENKKKQRKYGDGVGDKVNTENLNVNQAYEHHDGIEDKKFEMTEAFGKLLSDMGNLRTKAKDLGCFQLRHNLNWKHYIVRKWTKKAMEWNMGFDSAFERVGSISCHRWESSRWAIQIQMANSEYSRLDKIHSWLTIRWRCSTTKHISQYKGAREASALCAATLARSHWSCKESTMSLVVELFSIASKVTRARKRPSWLTSAPSDFRCRMSVSKAATKSLNTKNRLCNRSRTETGSRSLSFVEASRSAVIRLMKSSGADISFRSCMKQGQSTSKGIQNE